GSAGAIAASVGMAVGGDAGVGFAGAGVWAENVIRVHVKAIVDGDGANGISGAAVGVSPALAVEALDTSRINAVAGAAAVAFAFAGPRSEARRVGSARDGRAD